MIERLLSVGRQPKTAQLIHLPAREEIWPRHKVRILSPLLQQEGTTGDEFDSGLIKEHWLLQNLSTPADPFIHYLAYLFHPYELDHKKPVVILKEGIMLNGNIFRIPWRPSEDSRLLDFKDLNNRFSFANALAFAGYPVVIPYSRFAQWAYTRFVGPKLGAGNYFSDAINFNQLTEDFAFYVEAALELSGAKNAALVGFSKGGIETLFYLLSNDFDQRVKAATLIGTPVLFTKTDPLLRSLYFYSRAANILPFKKYHILSMLGRNIVTLKNIADPYMKKASGRAINKAAKHLFFIRDIYNPDNVTAEIIFQVGGYALEPIPLALLGDFLRWVHAGRVGDILSLLCGIKTPIQVLVGGEDKLASQANQEALFAALRCQPKEARVIPKTGHVDSIVGKNAPHFVAQIIYFLERFAGSS